MLQDATYNILGRDDSGVYYSVPEIFALPASTVIQFDDGGSSYQVMNPRWPWVHTTSNNGSADLFNGYFKSLYSYWGSWVY